MRRRPPPIRTSGSASLLAEGGELETHPALGGSYDQTPTGGRLVRPVRGGTLLRGRPRGGEVDGSTPAPPMQARWE